MRSAPSWIVALPSRPRTHPLQRNRPMTERLQKFLARMGLGSRQIGTGFARSHYRERRAGQLSTSVNGAEKIGIDGKLIQVRAFRQQRRVLAY